MKKTVVALVVLLLVAVVLLVGLDRHGFGLGGFRLDWSPHAAELEALARGFLEDVQYKDFEAAAAYHTHADRERANIPKLIERTFKVKPELLNIRDVRITEVDLDSEGRRARTFFTATTEVLNTSRKEREEPNRERQVEGILYWHLRPASEADPPPDDDAPAARSTEERWFMMLESSLR